MTAARYIINPVLEIVEPEVGTLNIVSPVDRFTLRDESGLITALIKAAARELEVAAFIQEQATQHLAVTVESTIAALVAKDILVAVPARKPLDSFFGMLEYGRTRSGPPLVDQPRFESPERWVVSVAGLGQLAERVKAQLAELGFTVEMFHAQKLADRSRSRLVVACADHDDIRSFRAINRAAVKAGVPAYYLSIDRQIVRAGPIVIPHQTACVECLFHRIASTRRYPAEYAARLEPEKVLATPRPSELALKAATAALDRVLFYVTGMATDLHLSPVREHDVLRGSVRTSNVLRLPRCPVCSTAAKRPAVATYCDVAAKAG